MTKSGKKFQQAERVRAETVKRTAQEIATDIANAEVYRKARLASIGCIVK